MKCIISMLTLKCFNVIIFHAKEFFLKNNNQEFILWAKKAHWILLLPFGVSLVIVFPLFYLTNYYLLLTIPPVFFLLLLLQIYFTSLVLTNKNLKGRFGFSKKYKFNIPLTEIENISINVSKIGSVLNYGTFVIKTSRDRYTVKYISNANLFKSQLLAELQSKKIM